MELEAATFAEKLGAVEAKLAEKDRQRDELKMQFEFEVHKNKEKLETLAVRRLSRY
jgi:hypothetical protein